MLYSGNIYIVLFFIYGISFFTMGVIALQQNIQKETNFPLLKAIDHLAYLVLSMHLLSGLLCLLLLTYFPMRGLFF